MEEQGNLKGAWDTVSWMLKDHHHRNDPKDGSHQHSADSALDTLQDHIALQMAQDELACMVKEKKTGDFIHCHILAMEAILNICLDDKLAFSWMKASIVVVKTQGHGPMHVQRILEWVIKFVHTWGLPLHKLSWKCATVLGDEEISQVIQFALVERVKKGHLDVTVLINIISSPEMQVWFWDLGIDRPSISECTAHCWLVELGWQYGKKQNGMYIDRHEHEDMNTDVDLLINFNNTRGISIFGIMMVMKVHILHLPLCLFLTPFSPKAGLGTPSRWQPHAQWQASHQWCTAVLLCWWSPIHAQLVQGHGSHYLWMGLWPEQGSLAAQCTDFHCPPGCTDCCCWWLRFTQPDFEGQQSQLQEFIEGCGHICFYPKYHCKLNFIKQFWGTAKFKYCKAPWPTTVAHMEKTVRESLDSVPLLQIQQWVLFCLFHLICVLSCSPGLQIILHISSPLTGRDSQVHRPPGPIRSIIVIIHYPPSISLMLEILWTHRCLSFPPLSKP